MKNKSLVIKVLVIAGLAIILPTIVISVRNASVVSEIDFNKPRLISSYKSIGDLETIEELKVVTTRLLEGKAFFWNGGNYYPHDGPRIHWDFDKDQNIVGVKLFWSAKKFVEKSNQLKKVWKLADNDSAFATPVGSTYEVKSWQGVRVAEDQLSATLVVTGRTVLEFSEGSKPYVLEQCQIRIVKEDGVWLLDEVVAIEIRG